MRPRKLGRVRTQGMNFQSSGTRMPYKRPGRFLKNALRNLVEPQGIEGQISGNVASGIGLQGVLALTTLARPNLITYKNSSTLAVNTINKRFFMRFSNVKFTMRNVASTNLKYQIYDCIARKDAPDLTLDTPLEAWQKGMLDFNPVPLSPTSIVGTTPFKSPEFNYYWKVLKVTPGQLEPGMSHEHTVRSPINKVLDSIKFENLVGNAVGGWTRAIMVVFSGSVIHNTAVPGSVTTSNVAFDYIQSVQDSFGFIEKNQPSYLLGDNLPKGPFVTAFMGESTDVPATTVIA